MPHRQPRCLSPHPPILVFSATWMVASYRPRASSRSLRFSSITGLPLDLIIPLDYALDYFFMIRLIMASKDSDVLKSLPTTSTTSSTSGSSALTSHRSCPRCARRMSSLKFDKYVTCVKCRDKQCSVDVRCSECEKWSVDFMLGSVKRHRTLVSKGWRSNPPSSTSTPPVVP